MDTPKGLSRLVLPQLVVGPLTRAAIFLVVCINPDQGSYATLRTFCADLSRLIRAVEFRNIEAGLTCITLNDAGGEIDVICGYRTPWSNEFLRTRSAHTGVARHSLHMQAEAIDIRLPGIPTSALRDAAPRLQRGGVGYYPSSDFVHVDVRPVRRW